MLTPENLKAISFTTSVATSDGEPVPGTEHEHILLFNVTQISEAEVSRLIDEDNWERNPRIVEVTRAQLKYLGDKS